MVPDRRDAPAPAVPAVSVIPLRDGPGGLEIFVQHRQASMDFAAGAVVFPGGRCDPEDEVAGAGLDLPEEVLSEHVRGWELVPSAGEDSAGRARTLVTTGLRELAEETGMRADPADLHPWDHWVTPEGLPKRFAVAFFVLPVDPRAPSQPRHLTSEATRSGWSRAEAVLEEERSGELLLLTPTRVMIEELVDLGDARTIIARRPVIAGVHEDRPETRPRPRR